MLPPQYKIYLLDQTELAELKKQIIKFLIEKKIGVSDSLYGAPILLPKRRMEDYVYVLIIVLRIKTQFLTPTTSTY